MIQGVQDRAAGGNVAAEYRFGHAETIIPLAALLKLPGSETATPRGELYTWENSAWRGDQVAPMGANIQWDAFQNERGDTLVRMLYNEKEVPFNEGCEPISEGSTFYTIDELAACLPLGATSDHSKARIGEGGDHSTQPSTSADVFSSQAGVWGVVAAVIGALVITAGVAMANAQQIKEILNRYGVQLPF